VCSSDLESIPVRYSRQVEAGIQLRFLPENSFYTLFEGLGSMVPSHCMFEIPHISNRSTTNMNYSLQMKNQQWQLIDQDEPGIAPVVIDFVSGKTAYRRKYGHAGGEPISKAVGIKKGHRPNIVDTTAGWGRDAFVLATMGCRVHMIERSEVIAKLLEDGLHRAEQDEKIGGLIKDKLSLTCGESRKELLHTPFEPEVIYLDPMFPQKEKSALVKKEMRVLQEVVGQDEDADALLNVALTIATNRVVVKRPAYANILAGIKPQTSIKTKKHRFDIYLIPQP
jgi:16S rRNA (guanine1516-N2)-methyltransferase